MTMRLLLDTCALIWLANGDRLAANAEREIEIAVDNGEGIVLSPISAWELGLLASRGRLAMPVSPQAVFRAGLALPSVSQVTLTADDLINSSYLPQNPPADPADRILIATAREQAMTIVTRDRAILASGEAGHVSTLAC